MTFSQGFVLEQMDARRPRGIAQRSVVDHDVKLAGRVDCAFYSVLDTAARSHICANEAGFVRSVKLVYQIMSRPWVGVNAFRAWLRAQVGADDVTCTMRGVCQANCAPESRRGACDYGSAFSKPQRV